MESSYGKWVFMGDVTGGSRGLMFPSDPKFSTSGLRQLGASMVDQGACWPCWAATGGAWRNLRKDSFSSLYKVFEHKIIFV